MRKSLCNADYKTIETKMIKYDLVSDLNELVQILQDNIQDMKRSDLVEIAKSLNNLLYKIEA